MDTDPLHQPEDVELGVTTGEDTDWGPAAILPAPVTRGFFVLIVTAAGLNWLRNRLIRTNLHRRKQP